MRFTLRDVLWFTALVAMGLAWWLDIRRRDGAVENAQYRKDYYNMMADIARADTEKAREMQHQALQTQKQLTELLQREREKEKAAATEAEISP
jgi:hypothetical protein